MPSFSKAKFILTEPMNSEIRPRGCPWRKQRINEVGGGRGTKEREAKTKKSREKENMTGSALI